MAERPGTDERQALADWYLYFANSPIPSQVFSRTGLLCATNQAALDIWGLQREQAGIGSFNILTDPQTIEQGRRPAMERVLQGETVVFPRATFDAARAGLGSGEERQRWIRSIFFPLYDATGTISHFGGVAQDITTEVEQEAAARTVRQALSLQQEEIAAQRATISNLSSPVLQVWEGILAVPLIGMIDANRATAVTESLLEEIVRRQADTAILDITGVPTVDTQVASYLIGAARACRLLGCQVALVGIGSEVAQTIVHLGVDMENIVTLANLQAGIAWALTRRGLAVVPAAGQAGQPDGRVAAASKERTIA